MKSAQSIVNSLLETRGYFVLDSAQRGVIEQVMTRLYRDDQRMNADEMRDNAHRLSLVLNGLTTLEESEHTVLEEKEGMHTIQLTVTDQALEELVPLLTELKRLGSMGCSRTIRIEDYEGQSKFGFDGDGSSKIKKLVVDGKES